MSPQTQTPDGMQAVRIDRFGGPEVMQLAEVPVPRPADGELLVRVGAASLNPVDWKIREGRYPVVKEDRLPYVLGRDYAGVVVGCGAGADFAEGDAVYGLLDPAHGSFADYVVVRGDEAAARPTSLDAVAAAALPLAGLTAWQGLFTHGRLAAGQRLPALLRRGGPCRALPRLGRRRHPAAGLGRRRRRRPGVARRRPGRGGHRTPGRAGVPCHRRRRDAAGRAAPRLTAP